MFLFIMGVTFVFAIPVSEPDTVKMPSIVKHITVIFLFIRHKNIRRISCDMPVFQRYKKIGSSSECVE